MSDLSPGAKLAVGTSGARCCPLEPGPRSCRATFPRFVPSLLLAVRPLPSSASCPPLAVHRSPGLSSRFQPLASAVGPRAGPGSLPSHPAGTVPAPPSFPGSIAYRMKSSRSRLAVRPSATDPRHRPCFSLGAVLRPRLLPDVLAGFPEPGSFFSRLFTFQSH